MIHEYKGTDECFSIINSSGETVCTNLQEVGKYFCDGLLPVVMSDGSSGYLNEQGALEIPCDFYIDYGSHGPKVSARLDYLFSDGIAVVCRQERAGHSWYLMDRAGNSRKLDNKYTPNDFKFHNGFLVVEYGDGGNKRYDFIRKDGEARFGKPFTYAESFVNGYAVAVLDGRDVLVSADGTILDVQNDILAH